VIIEGSEMYICVHLLYKSMVIGGGVLLGETRIYPIPPQCFLLVLYWYTDVTIRCLVPGMVPR